MSKDHRLSRIYFTQKVKYNEEYNLYTLQLHHKRRRPWWLLLLLLLPLLLFIKCEKSITVECYEPDSHLAIAGQPVEMAYQTHFLWNNGQILATEEVRRTQQTDSTGITVFEKLPCSVYSYVFHCLSKVSFTAQSDCHAAADVKFNFHYTWHADLPMQPRLEDLHIMLVDKETGDILPDGVLVYQYTEQGKVKTDSVVADASGIATMPQMRYCSVMKQLIGKCYGYADTIHTEIPCQMLKQASDSMALRLRPLKERFTFFVKSKATQQPIPDAVCTVSLTHPGNSRTTTMRKVKTSIDGKGIAVYDDAFVLSTISITASKVHYKDGQLEGGPWTVEKFNLQSDDIRTIWLEPEPYLQEFINIDSISSVPIAGVRNEILLTHPDGKQERATETSNRNGIFPVSAMEDDRIQIVSTKSPAYYPKQSAFPVFKEIKDKEKKIRMRPVMETLRFRTVREEKANVLLPDCDLQINGSESGKMQPSNSGNGEFDVAMRKYERISIVASRKGYTTNRTKVNNCDWDYLRVNQERRDIPLHMELPPCSGGQNTPKQANEMRHQRSYGMGQEEGNASISGDFYSEPDLLTVYDGPDTSGRILIGPNRSVKDKFNIPFHFTKGAVTVVISTSPHKSSSWVYVVNCPNYQVTHTQ